MNNSITNLDELRQFIGKRLAYYGVPKLEQDRYDQAMKLLVDRCADSRLYLGVVGEFSTGKSTLINALMGIEILKEDILPATTCAPTILTYGENFEVEIYENGNSSIIKYSDAKGVWNKAKDWFRKIIGTLPLVEQINEAKSFITEYTANEENARNITKVIIYLPSSLPIFENGVSIVDTPGINAENPRHQKVTCQTVKQICDLSLVLTPATAPCSRTLLSFINEYLTCSEKYCIGLITQIDRVRKAERKRQETYVYSRLASEGIHLQDVFAIAPYCVLHPSEYKSDECEVFQSEFNNTISKICETLRKNKREIVVLKLQTFLIDVIANQITPLLSCRESEIRERCDELERNQLGNFDQFLLYGKEHACHNSKRYAATVSEIENISLKAYEQLKQVMSERIETASSRSELKKRTDGKSISKYMFEIRVSIIDKELLAIEKRINKAIQESFTCFADNFNSEFRNLARHANAQVSITNELQGVESNNITVITGLEQIIKYVNIRIFAITGGATTGGIIGGLVGGPLVAILGAGIGGFISSLFGKSLDELKRIAKEQSEELSEKWHRDLIPSLTEQIDNYYKKMEKEMTEAIDGFVVIKPQVLDIISKEKKQQEQMRLLIEEIRDDENLLKRIADKPREILTNLAKGRM